MARIGIVGAGPGGLCAALAFALHGHEVEVFEQAAELGAVGAGIQVSPNGWAALAALGLGDALAARSMRAQAVRLCDYRQSREVLRLDLLAHSPARPYFFIHRADLLDVLAQAVSAAGGVIRTGTRISDAQGGYAPRLFAQAGREAQRELTFDLVVGADGLHSGLRGRLNPSSAGRFTGHVAWRALVRREDVGVHPPEAVVHMAPRRHLVSYPLRGGREINLVAVEERTGWRREGWHYQGEQAQFRRIFSGFGGLGARLIAAVDTPLVWGLFAHPVAPVWHGGGLVLLGDSAHPMVPFLAQGANMAFEDAYTLAREFSRTPDRATGLRHYQALRQARCARVAAAALGNARNYHLAHPLLRRFAHGGLRLLGAVAPGAMLKSYEWLYGHDVTAQQGPVA